jgi:hypothetical protein
MLQSSLFSMYDASGGCGHHRDVHDDAWRRQGSNFGDGETSAVSLTFSFSRHHPTASIITCRLLPSPLSTTELNEAQLTQ